MRVLPTEKLDAIDLERLSPMMRQYVAQKREQPDCLLFFRLGDFYEMFFDDALVASAELEIALTARDCGQDEKAPMCGVPYHAAENYINKLIQKNYKIAISEQLEDPATTKGLVKRGIVRIVTPGTVTNTDTLEEGRHNYLLSVYAAGRCFGLAAVDITTGDFTACALTQGATEAKLAEELARYQASEIIANLDFSARLNGGEARALLNLRDESYFDPEGYAAYLKPGGEAEPGPAEPETGALLWPQAAAGLLRYVEETQQGIPPHLQALRLYRPEGYLAMDPACRRHLELCANSRDGRKQGSLLWVLDRTRTAMGQRLLRAWIEQPLLSLPDIRARQSSVAELKEAYILRQELREHLAGIHDMARLIGKLGRRQVNARDLLALCQSLDKIPFIKALLADCRSAGIRELTDALADFAALSELLRAALNDEAPLTIKDGELIRPGFNAELDELRSLAGGGKDRLLELEVREREASGIKNLKLGYNRVFGYYLEVSKGNLGLVPAHFIRKQTLVNAERFVTEELKGMEDAILAAAHRLVQFEYELFCTIRETVFEREAELSAAAGALSALDALQSLAEVAEREHYCRPLLAEDARLIIKNGRHPLVEKLMPRGSFVPNDCRMNGEERRLAILTGPNMGGKSTYMRQVALIALMAQMGSFVPAESAEIGLVSQLFTRIGASDDLGSGDSTFMVEMKELSYILSAADARSLLILDEIGRGTSTFDGLAIAWACIEFLAEKAEIGARTLFATHYHELVDLAKLSEGIFNAHVTVERRDDSIHFLHRIEEGGADESYGIEVAKLAGIPQAVVARARDILTTLESANENRKRLRVKKRQEAMPGEQNLFSAQLQFGRYNDIIDELRALQIDALAPLDALNKLAALAKEARKL